MRNVLKFLFNFVAILLRREQHISLYLLSMLALFITFLQDFITINKMKIICTNTV